MLKKNTDKTNIMCSAIIVAGGASTRVSGETKKQFIDILDKPILAYSIEVFERCELVDEIIIITREEDIIYCSNAVVKPYQFEKVSKVVSGGSTRQHSVYNGLKEVSELSDIIAIHDGARPLVGEQEIEQSIHECFQYNAVITGIKTKDTIKIVDKHKNIIDTPQRETIWVSQTPQTFKADLILNAHQKAIKEGFVGTDDSILVERLGYDVKVVEGNYRNIKITTDEDIDIVQAFLESKLTY